jgi:hypothetical protein
MVGHAGLPVLINTCCPDSWPTILVRTCANERFSLIGNQLPASRGFVLRQRNRR